MRKTVNSIGHSEEEQTSRMRWIVERTAAITGAVGLTLAAVFYTAESRHKFFQTFMPAPDITRATAPKDPGKMERARGILEQLQKTIDDYIERGREAMARLDAAVQLANKAQSPEEQAEAKVKVEEAYKEVQAVLEAAKHMKIFVLLTEVEEDREKTANGESSGIDDRVSKHMQSLGFPESSVKIFVDGISQEERSQECPVLQDAIATQILRPLENQIVELSKENQILGEAIPDLKEVESLPAKNGTEQVSR